MAKRPGLNLTKIVDAALELMQQSGTQSLTMSSLAQHFGVKPPSLYSHVQGLSEVQRAMRLRGLRELLHALRQACVGLAGRDALVALCHAYRRFSQENPVLYQMTLANTEHDDTELNQAGTELLQLVFAILQAYQLDGNDLVHATRCLRSALHGFVALENGGAFGMPVALDASFEHLIRHLDSMFANWGTPPFGQNEL